MVKVKNKVLAVLSIMLCMLMFSGAIILSNTKSLNAETEIQSQDKTTSQSESVASVTDLPKDAVEFSKTYTYTYTDTDNVEKTTILSWSSYIMANIKGRGISGISDGNGYDFCLNSIIFTKTQPESDSDYVHIGNLPTGIEVWEKTTTENKPVYIHGDNQYDLIFYSDKDIYAPEDASGLFGSCGYISVNNPADINMITYIDFSNFKTDRVTSMKGMFAQGYNCRFEPLTLVGFENLNTENVTDMSGMFDFIHGCLNADLSRINTSSVTNMENMFRCVGDRERISSNSSKVPESFSLDLSHFDTRNVTDMSSMFNGCQSLKELDLSNFDMSSLATYTDMLPLNTLNKLIIPKGNKVDLEDNEDGYNWYNETDNNKMIFALPTNNLVPFTLIRKEVASFPEFDAWQEIIAGVTSKPSYNITSIAFERTVDASKYNLTVDVTNKIKAYINTNDNNYDIVFVSNETIYCPVMAYNLFELGGEETRANIESITFNNFSTVKCEDMKYMFMMCYDLTNLDLSNFDTINVTDMSGMFSDCVGLKSINFGNSINTSNVTRIGSLFGGCSNLESVDLSKFDLSNIVARFSKNVFSGCTSLARIKLPKQIKTGGTLDLPTAWSTELTEKGASKYCLTADETLTAVTTIDSTLISNHAGETLELYTENGDSLATPVAPVEPPTGVNASVVAIIVSAVILLAVITYVVISSKNSKKRKVNAKNIDSSKRK